jgi:predicted AlkP superfamily pyrophosphatase or phosphodiesterase
MKSNALFSGLLAACLVACVPPTPPQSLQPTVILFSIDGFRWDYLDRGLTPNLTRLAGEGVRAEALIPVFPTKTFPNHASIVTGRYPAHHGIIGNTFTAPDIGGRLSMTDRVSVRDGRFWLAEPIWVTAERQGQRTAPFFWPGSEAAIGEVRPTYAVPYDPGMRDPARVTRVLRWLDLSPRWRPTFLTMYLSGVDEAGHRYGPDTPETRAAIAHADTIVGLLLDGLSRRGIADQVNLIIVSDHGMMALSPDRTIELNRYVPSDWIDVDNLSPTLMAWPRKGMEESVYTRLAAVPHLTVFRRADLPARFHLDGPRVPPIVALADPGWKIRDGGPFTRWTNGDHGYDDTVTDMRAIFLAHGPAFRHGVVVPAFRNIHVYALIAKVLRLKPNQTDGSLDSVRDVLATTVSSGETLPEVRRPR